MYIHMYHVHLLEADYISFPLQRTPLYYKSIVFIARKVDEITSGWLKYQWSMYDM
jgi:hypothetical protein